ncbi:hypothetical protein BH20ACT5_BH20ACT5_16360 [soil metagenome]
MTMIAPSTEPAEPAVIPPCPVWCRLAPGHSYPSLTPDLRGVSRGHDGHPDAVGASITQEEHYRDGVISFGPNAITVLPTELDMQELTAAEARSRAADEIRRAGALAAELLAAADQLDALTAAEVQL